MAEEFGWLALFDGTGSRLAARRVAPCLLGMHAGREGSLVLWNEEDLYVGRGTRLGERCRLEGRPLGWYADPLRSGLLCVSGGAVGDAGCERLAGMRSLETRSMGIAAESITLPSRVVREA